jgi:cytochrome c biogenesis protein CcmG, thiol:disulfide interchange protein DsbE
MDCLNMHTKKNRLLVILSAALVLSACNRAETKQPAQGSAAVEKPAPAATASTTAAATAEVGTDVGAAMPAYSTAMLDGSKFDVAAERGNVLLLNVWATWCGPCRYEIPELQKLHGRYAAQKFKVIGVSIDDTGEEGVRQFVNENKIDYPIALDAEAKLANIFQTSVLPTTVLIDRSGRIVWKKYGLIESGDKALTDAIEAALRG